MYQLIPYEVPKTKTSETVEYSQFYRDNLKLANALNMTTKEYLKQNNIVFTGEKLKYPGHEFRQGKKYIVYALTKDNMIYIGKTEISLEYRYSLHLKNPLFKEFDISWDINFIMLTDNSQDEYYVIHYYKQHKDFISMNKRTYEKINDPETFDFKTKEARKIWYEGHIDEVKEYNSRPEKKQERNHYQKTSQHAKKYRSGYYKYYKKAKQEGLTVKEYKIKHNII